MENSGIAWTDHTFNPWIGCTKVGPGCQLCYAEDLATRRLGVEWGPGKARRRTKPQNWSKVRKWHREAEKAGVRPWVFVASLADVFDNEVDPAWRADLFALVDECRNLNFIFVTKRIGNGMQMLPPFFARDYPHVGVVATVVTQAECDRDAPKLRALKDMGLARWIGLSIEPQIEKIAPKVQGIDWIITAGESDQGGQKARDYDVNWVTPLLAYCIENEAALFVKQFGSAYARANGFCDKAGADPMEWLRELRIQQMPFGVPTTIERVAQ